MGNKAEWMDLNDAIKDHNKSKERIEKLTEMVEELKGTVGNFQVSSEDIQTKHKEDSVKVSATVSRIQNQIRQNEEHHK